MKNFFLTTLAALVVVTSASKSMAADELVDLVKCRPAILTPDLSMSLTLSAGGIAGLTMIKVERFYLGHSTSQNYVVRQLPVNPQHNGQAVIFLGEDISFEANFSAVTNDGGAPGLLKLRLGTNDFSFEELSCVVLRTNPEVNYVY